MELAWEQMWRTLNMMKGDFNYRELAALSSTELVSVLPCTANHYLINLHQAGYICRTTEGKGFGCEGIPARYKLIVKTGPRPPIVQIYDPNLDKIVWIKPIDEETAIYGGR